MAPQTLPSSELSHRPSRLSGMPDATWPTVLDVWFDHAAGVILLRKTLRLPVPKIAQGGLVAASEAIKHPDLPADPVPVGF